jgi:hypothetical protein
MNSNDIKNKNLVLCDFIADLTNKKYKVKPEYSTSNKDNENVIVIQEQSGEKIVFYDNPSLYNYYNVEIFANSIQEAKDTSVEIGNLIGENIYFDWKNQKWQIMVKQFSNPRTIAYEDIRRVSYTMTLQVIINRIA